MKSLVIASFLLLLMVGCQNQQSQMNPFAVYGPQRLPPPGTQTYGQPAQTAPYYQGPAAGQVPTIQGGYQTNPPAQFTPPPNTAPTNSPPSSYGSQQWRSVSESSPSGTTSGSVVPASYTEEVNMSTSASTPVTSPSTTTASGTSTNPYVRGMHVNEVTEVVPVQAAPATMLAPPATSAMPSTSWSTPTQGYSSSTSGSISPSRIP
ncbi:hypothetical protein C5Y96_20785 [Blastopirellula marina]|uniref:Uncharacterized protein n=1 Tax=Blastopirellula marina TaxID=124 RepID=A0A2S8F1W0_9BACT|nr:MULTISPECIES: hypothetical protein [Pirellulaceae]PQO25894.1 hypothetical protein C5Y96_20785 [Blastopirellula marina]RCS44252.1 hypothetical protein DTL36_20830 [Bremerella cremea]